MIEIFAQFGAHLDCKAKNLRTPLHVACIRGNAPVLQALLNQGADFDAKDCDGNTPCHMISQYGHTQCLEVLLEKHPKLVTYNAQAYRIKCLYNTGEQNFNSSFNVQVCKL